MTDTSKGPTFAELLEQPTWSEAHEGTDRQSDRGTSPLDALMARPADTVIEGSRVELRRHYMTVAGTEYVLEEGWVSWDEIAGHIRSGGLAWLAEGPRGWRVRTFQLRPADLPPLRSRYLQVPRDDDDWGLTGSRWSSQTGQVAYFLGVTC